MTAAEHQTVNLAIGRILGMMQRPTQDGDVAEYERCRSLILDIVNPAPFEPAHCWVRDRNKGAQGD